MPVRARRAAAAAQERHRSAYQRGTRGQARARQRARATRLARRLWPADRRPDGGRARRRRVPRRRPSHDPAARAPTCEGTVAGRSPSGCRRSSTRAGWRSTRTVKRCPHRTPSRPTRHHPRTTRCGCRSTAPSPSAVCVPRSMRRPREPEDGGDHRDTSHCRAGRCWRIVARRGLLPVPVTRNKRAPGGVRARA